MLHILKTKCGIFGNRNVAYSEPFGDVGQPQCVVHVRPAPPLAAGAEQPVAAPPRPIEPLLPLGLRADLTSGEELLHNIFEMRDEQQKGGSGYLDVADALLGDIRSGKYAAERPFPSLTAIMRRFGVSRVTASRAVEQLRRRGAISTEPGSGSRVRNRSIGLVLPGLAYSEVFQPILARLSALCRRNGYSLIFGGAFSGTPEECASQARDLAVSLVKQHVSGVILQPATRCNGASESNRAIVSTFAEASIPIVLVDYDIEIPPERSGYDMVGLNNFEAGRCMGAHLLEAGARRIAFLVHPNASASVSLRHAGVAAAVAAAAAARKGKNTRHKADATCEFFRLDVEPDDKKAVASALRRLKPDAFVCGNDKMAARLNQTLSALGRRIPDDVMLAGFDDIQIARAMTPQLTTMHQPCEDIATTAFRTLLERIANPSLPSRDIFLSAPLVARESTARQQHQKTAPTSSGITR
jgi:LacI family transcriptional regulator